MKRKIIETQVKYYRYDISDSDEWNAYKTLTSELKNNGLVLSDSISGDYQLIKSFLDKIQVLEKRGKVELDTKFLFNNQWNTTEASLNLRVFDWSEEIYPNKDIKEGYYLTPTDEMKEIRENTFQCGYCGKQYYPKPMKEFCLACLEGEHLEKRDLHLLRIKNLGVRDRDKLTDKERDHLIPLYTEAQIKGTSERGIERIKKQRVELLDTRDETIKTANTEYEGYIWLLDRGIKTGNVIYYNHTDMFCFGWKTNLSSEIKEELAKELRGFPFNYEFNKK